MRGSCWKGQERKAKPLSHERKAKPLSHERKLLEGTGEEGTGEEGKIFLYYSINSAKLNILTFASTRFKESDATFRPRTVVKTVLWTLDWSAHIAVAVHPTSKFCGTSASMVRMWNIWFTLGHYLFRNIIARPDCRGAIFIRVFIYPSQQLFSLLLRGRITKR
jgi:hypothetical protein